MLTKKPEIISRWKQYYEKIMPSNDQVPIYTREVWVTSEPSLMRNEIPTAIDKIHNHKAPGIEKIVAKIVAFGEICIDAIHKICTKIWNTGKWSKEWCESIYNPNSNL